MLDRSRAAYEKTPFAPIYRQEQAEKMNLFARLDRQEITEQEAERQLAQINVWRQKQIARTAQEWDRMHPAPPPTPQVLVVERPVPAAPRSTPGPYANTVDLSLPVQCR